jgi:hypothetical protein
MSYAHVHPDFRYVVDLSDAERLEFLEEPRWLGYPLAQQIMDTLTCLLRKPTRPRMTNVLLVGDSNNGKTTIIRRFDSLCGRVTQQENGNPSMPILLAEAPPSADERSLYISILERLLTPYRPTDPVAKLRYQVIHLCRSCRVRMLIIDEFHSLLAGTPIKQREVMNAIKLMCNELAIPIVGVGTRDAVRVLHTDPQHASRFDVVQLPLWKADVEFQRLLVDFEQILPLKQVSRLHQPFLAQMLHSISGGNLGNLHRLLIQCARLAITSGAEQIDANVIGQCREIQPTRGIRELV